jgi:hypothetical protein
MDNSIIYRTITINYSQLIIGCILSLKSDKSVVVMHFEIHSQVMCETQIPTFEITKYIK